MSGWNDEQLASIGRASQLEIAPRRADGSLRPFTTIWVVRVEDDLYVRSWNGPDGSWYRAVRTSGRGRIRTAGVEQDVSLDPADTGRAAVDAAYRDKYGASRYTDAMVADGPAATTMRLVPR